MVEAFLSTRCDNFQQIVDRLKHKRNLFNTGDCNMAVCGGVNAVLTPTIFIQLSRARMASQIGQCQAFSADADGYARGEGCGIVLLKRLSDV